MPPSATCRTTSPTDEFAADSPTTLADAYQAAILALSPGAPAALAEWTTHWGPALSAFADALVRQTASRSAPTMRCKAWCKALDGTPSALTLSELASGLGLTGVQVGTGGADALARGSATGLQVYVAGGGNDTLTGGIGQDVYVFGRGFGQDTISEADAGETGDRVRLALYNPDEVTITREGMNLVIAVDGSTDKITIVDHFAAADGGPRRRADLSQPPHRGHPVRRRLDLRSGRDRRRGRHRH